MGLCFYPMRQEVEFYHKAQETDAQKRSVDQLHHELCRLSASSHPNLEGNRRPVRGHTGHRLHTCCTLTYQYAQVKLYHHHTLSV